MLNLELYFEHRNYLAAAFLLLPLLVLLRQRTSDTVFFAVAFTALFALGSFTRYSATIWSDYPRMVEASARKAPTSMRAQQQYAVNLFNDGRFDEAIKVLDRAVANVPNDAGIHVARATVLCSGGRLTGEDFDDMTKFVAAKRYDIRALQLYSSLTEAVINGNCPDVSAIQLRQLFEAMLTLPDNADPVQARFAQIKFLAGVAEIALGEPELATAAFEESLVSRPGAGRAMRMASLLATAGYYMDALALSAIALQDLEVAGSDLFSGTRVRKSDIEAFRTQLQAEIDREAAAPKPNCGDDWYALVESKLPTGDGAGHGPDPGSDEWRSVVEFRLGIRGDATVPDRSTPDWCKYIDTQLEGLN